MVIRNVPAATRALARSQKTSVKKALSILEKYPRLRAKLKKKLQQKNIAIPSNLGALGLETSVITGETTASDGSTSWMSIGKDLVDLYATVKASEEMDKSDQRALELELEKIREQNKAIDKQLALQREVTKQTGIQAQRDAMVSDTGFDFTEFFRENRGPLLAVAGLLGTLLYLRLK